MLKMQKEFYGLCQLDNEFQDALDRVCSVGLNLIVKGGVYFSSDGDVLHPFDGDWDMWVENDRYKSSSYRLYYRAVQNIPNLKLIYDDYVKQYGKHTNDDELQKWAVDKYMGHINCYHHNENFVIDVTKNINDMVNEYESYKTGGRDIILTNSEEGTV